MKRNYLRAWQGFPDFAGSLVARRAAARAIEDGSAVLNQYSPQPGLLGLRQSVANFVERRYGARYDPASEVAITAGAQEALAAAFLSFLEPGDEVTGAHSGPTNAAGTSCTKRRNRRRGNPDALA